MRLRLLTAVAMVAGVLLVAPAPVSRAQPGEHVVERGDTLRGIAERYGISLADLLAANDLPNPDLILIGQALRLSAPAPADRARGPAPAVEERSHPPLSSRGGPRPATHVVQPGETLYRIAERYAVAVRELLAENDLPNPHLIVVGQELRLPAAPAADATATPAPPAEHRGVERPAVHVVQPGETLHRIARLYGLGVADLLAANDLPNPDALRIGQELALPEDAAPRPAPAAEPTAPAPAERLPAVGGRYPLGTTLTAKITMYCLRGRMANGEPVHEGAAAADRSVFPFGTIIEVAGLGRYVVKDRFARDLGDLRLDVWQPSCAAAIAWGLVYREITVAGP